MMADARVLAVKRGGIVTPMVGLPSNAAENVSTRMHGVEVRDPYAWMNDSESRRVKEWTKRQDAYTRKVIDGQLREYIRGRLAEIESGAEMEGVYGALEALPSGKYRYFQMRRLPGDEYKVLYYMDGLDGEAKIAIDPNTLSKDGKTSMIEFFPNDNGTLAAFTTSRHNNDDTTIRIIDIESGRMLKDKIEHVTFASVAWIGNEGFYYSKWPDLKNYPDGKKVHQVYYHELGTSESKDVPIFGKGLGAERSCGVSTDTKGHYLFIYVSDNVNNDVYYKNLHPNASPEIKVLVQGRESEFYVMDQWDGRFMAVTSDGAPNYKVISFDISNHTNRGWKTVIPEMDMPIVNYTFYNNKIILEYSNNAFSELCVFSTGGKRLGTVELPMKGYCDIPDPSKTGNEPTRLIFRMSSPVHPHELYEFNYGGLRAKKLKLKSAPKSDRMDMSNFEYKQVWCKSADGTDFPMFMVNKKGMERNGKNPVILTGYGGFNTVNPPEFDSHMMPFIEDGGILCIANIRGGGEYGRDWYFSGINKKKQNSYDDFIAAAEWLINNNYTSKDRLAIWGRSNGGLLTAAVMVQRPDLFRAVVSEMPLTDLIGADRFDIGPLCRKEYGDPAVPGEFAAMMKYSPYHNVKKGEKYPALMVIGGEYDTRCDPLHARKFAAIVQDSTGSGRPVLLLMQKDMGHGGQTMPVKKSQQLDWTADWLTFVYKELGMDKDIEMRQLEQLKRSG